MIIGTVIGTVAATIRSRALEGLPLVKVDVGPATGIVVACNPMSAGQGQQVLISCGTAARNALGAPETAVDATVVAILDAESS